MIHTYEDGCVVTKKDVYTIFEHNNAIAGLDKTQYCTTDALATIRYDGRAASSTAPFYLKSLKVDLPTGRIGRHSAASWKVLPLVG